MVSSCNVRKHGALVIRVGITVKAKVFVPLILGVLLAAWLLLAPAGADNLRTVGLMLNGKGSLDGYTLFSPLLNADTYLIDNNGNVVHTWDTGGGTSEYLLEDGSLFRTIRITLNSPFAAGGATGGVRHYAWDGTLIWEFDYMTEEHMLHHDIEVLPNGNVLLVTWELISAEDAIAAGRDPALLPEDELWSLGIIEVAPTGPTTGDIVWEWHAEDHLIQDFDPLQANHGVVADHAELIDLNYFDVNRPGTVPVADWLHTNAIDYNAELDQIAVSVRHFSELWVIDHSTTVEEAASHSGGDSGMGGDLLYRWGNPQSYDAGDAEDQQLFLQHDVRWIDAGLPGAGNITIFNNGRGRLDENYSTADEILPPLNEEGTYAITAGDAFGPAAPGWSYTAPSRTDFYSGFVSGAIRLPNGNTLIASGGQGWIFEVTEAGEVVWEYISPITSDGPLAQGEPTDEADNFMFRATRYPMDYAAFDGKDLIPLGPIELPDPDKPTPTVTDTPTSTPTPTPTPTPQADAGDANCSGAVDSIDVAFVLQFTAGLLAELPCEQAADVNGDGSIDARDATLILQFIAGLLTAL